MLHLKSANRISVTLLLTLLFGVAGCETSVRSSGAESRVENEKADARAATERIVGEWCLSGRTILAHDAKAPGARRPTEDDVKKLMPLADELGREHRLEVTSDGKWNLHSFRSGDTSELEFDIFRELTGGECNWDPPRKYCYPNSHKQPSHGTWKWQDGGLWHNGIGGIYPIKNAGPIVVTKAGINFVDGVSGEVMSFRFLEKNRSDPDPRFR